MVSVTRVANKTSKDTPANQSAQVKEVGKVKRRGSLPSSYHSQILALRSPETPLGEYEVESDLDQQSDGELDTPFSCSQIMETAYTPPLLRVSHIGSTAMALQRRGKELLKGRLCVLCDQELPEHSFGKNRRQVAGEERLHGWECKVCLIKAGIKPGHGIKLKSSYRGVDMCRGSSKWRAQITVYGDQFKEYCNGKKGYDHCI